MNENHARLCPSPEWATMMHEEVLPPLVDGFGRVELGDRLLEIGPGPGATTEWLRHRVPELVAVEIDPDAAAALRERFADTNVEIVDGDATALPCADASVDTVATFTMLHHVPTPARQNRVLAEALRVLRPGGWLIGSDSLPSTDLHEFHVDDVYNPIEPSTLVTRLQTIGYASVLIEVGRGLRFRARKAAVDE